MQYLSNEFYKGYTDRGTGLEKNVVECFAQKNHASRKTGIIIAFAAPYHNCLFAFGYQAFEKLCKHSLLASIQSHPLVRPAGLEVLIPQCVILLQDCLQVLCEVP